VRVLVISALNFFSVGGYVFLEPKIDKCVVKESSDKYNPVCCYYWGVKRKRDLFSVECACT